MTDCILWGDIETCSEINLKIHGASRYAEHPSTRIQIFTYAFDGGPVHLWNLEEGEEMPLDLWAAFKDPDVILWFHNSFFDRTLIEQKLGIVLPIERWRCSMAMALSHGLPARLGDLCTVLGLPEDKAKVKDGRRLVLKFCQPRKQKDKSLKWCTPVTDPEDWAKYLGYASGDVVAMRACVKRIQRWNYPTNDFERQLWFLDQKVNDRGMAIDLELVNAAVTAIEKEQALLAKSTHKMTDGAVETAGQRDAMLKYIAEQYGRELPNLQKAPLQRLLRDGDLPEPLQALLEVRLSTCTTSTAKYKRILQVVNADGRVRGAIQFAGAARTSRDGGRLTQIQNYPSRNLMSQEDTRLGVLALKAGMAETVGADIMRLTSSCLRNTVVAAPGKKLIVADLSNIEGRIVAWLAQEEWKLQAFRDFDAGNGPDIYKASYAKAFNVDVETVTKQQRNGIGKVQELAFAYGGSVGAVVTFALSFGMTIEGLADQLRPSIPEDILTNAEGFYDWMKQRDVKNAKKAAIREQNLYEKRIKENTKEAKAALKKSGPPRSADVLADLALTHILAKEVYAPLDGLKQLWRKGHPGIVKLWGDAERACRDAVENPEVKFPFGNNCVAIKNKNCVRIISPSGHSLPYPAMNIDVEGGLYFMGNSQDEKKGSKKWRRIYTHGGKLVENLSQSMAWSVFKHGSLLAENDGYPIIFPMHDEIAVETPDTEEYTVAGLCAHLSTVPAWAGGLPLAAAGFSDSYYHKDFN